LVSFWIDEASFDAGDPPFLVCDFCRRLPLQGLRIVKDGRGFWKRADTRLFVDPDTLVLGEDEPPWERERFDLDYRQELLGDIERYILRATEHNYQGDHTSRAGIRGEFSADGQVVREGGHLVTHTIETDDTDGTGILARPAVVALKGERLTR
jgi:hypothetical protein